LGVVDAEHAEGLLALGLVADVERDLAGRRTQLVEKLLPESGDQVFVA
jgi:hypothetical protein